MTHKLFDIFSVAFLAGLFCSYAVAFYFVFRKAIKEFSLLNWIVLALIFAVSADQFVLQYPGIISYDDAVMMDKIFRTGASQWHSITYSLLANALLLVTGSPFRTSLIGAALAVLIVPATFLLFRPTRFRWRILAASLLFLSPYFSTQIVALNRDSIFSLLFLLLAIQLIALTRSGFRNLHLAGAVVLLCLLGGIRPEAILLPFAFTFYFAWKHRSKRRDLKKAALLLLGFAIWFTALQTLPFASQAEKTDVYQATTIANPLNYIVQNAGDDITSVEKAAISRFFRYEDLVNYYSPFDITPFAHGGLVANSTHEDYLAFRSAAIGILFRHWPDFLVNRVLMTGGLLDPPGRIAGRIGDEDEYMRMNREHYSSSNIPRISMLQAVHLSFLNGFFAELPAVLRYPFGSAGVPLLFIVFACFWRRAESGLGLASALVLIRLVPLLLLAPAAYFKYVASVWFIGWLAFLLILEEKNASIEK
jgi:hypothetical protein